MDGKMLNARLGNAWQARGPFCNAVPKDLRDGIDLMTDIKTLKDIPVAPLHVLLRTGEAFFKAGIRLNAGVFKYNVELTEEEKIRISDRFENNSFYFLVLT